VFQNGVVYEHPNRTAYWQYTELILIIDVLFQPEIGNILEYGKAA
jgi:hypothetical protein